MRGKLSIKDLLAHLQRITPADAGKTILSDYIAHMV